MLLKPLIIIGAGLAAYTLAKEIRKLDGGISICIVTADDGSFYSKPMLSNALTKGLSASKLATASAEKMAADHKLEIKTNTHVTSIDVQAHTVTTDGGPLDYAKLVLAVGAIPIHPPLTGDAVDQVMTVNNLSDYARFQARVDQAQRFAVIGPGLIGCEFANDLTGAGKNVAVIGPDHHPLGRLLPPVAGLSLQEGLAAAGIEWHLNTTADQVNEDGKEGFQVVISDAPPVMADVVLSAIGLRPDTTLAQQAGISCERGIVVDSQLQTSAEDIYALGDCAEMNGQVRPFIMPIMHGARALAKTLTGDRCTVKYPPMPVLVKTPSCPVMILPPPDGAAGEWVEEAVSGGGVRARFLNNDGELLGFALTASAVTEKALLLKALVSDAA